MAIPMMVRLVRLACCLSALGFLILPGTSSGAQASGVGAFTGNADAVFGSVNSQSVSATPTAFPPATSAPQQNSRTNFHFSNDGITIAVTGLLQASTVFANGAIDAKASLPKFTVTIQANGNTSTISADAATSQTTGRCVNGLADLKHSTTVTNPSVLVNGKVPSGPSPITLDGFGTLTMDFSFQEGTGAAAGLEAAAFQIESNDKTTSLDLAFTSVHVNCSPGVPSTGGGPIAQTGERPSWLLWGALLAALGLFGLSGTLVVRKHGLR